MPQVLANGSLDTRARARTLDDLEAHRFDCAVIGGGITGAGIAREAALRGLSVAVVEAEDFAAGTSSRSSKLIHGGLRYLALGDVPLVRETALERKRVFRLAPHLAEPCWLVVPVRSRAGLLKFRAALATYEKLGAVEERDRHRNWSAEDLAREEPLLRRERYPLACAYREYLTEDARLVLANLRAAVQRGALAVNHAAVDGVVVEGGRATGVEASCRLTGRRLRVRARSVVNAAGPWVEALRRLEDPQAPSLLHLSKGVHVVVPRQRLPLHHIAILGARDKRSIFAIPRGPVVYVGTTDTSHSGAPELWPDVTRADVEYLLEPLPRIFDVAPLVPEECVAAWAGLRPLVAEPGKAPTEISRRDEVSIGPAGLVSVAGGKLTGYRKMAESVLGRVEQVVGHELPEPHDADEPLPGGNFDGDLDRLAASLAASASLEPAVAARLARLYGSEAPEVAKRGDTPLAPGAPVLAGEVDWAVCEEAAATLDDVLYRRTRAALYEPAIREELLEPIARRMAPYLGWDGERTVREIESSRTRLASELTFRTAEPS